MNWSKIEYKPVKLGDTATFINGYPFKPTDWSEEGLPIIRIQNLTGNAYESNFFSGKIADKYFVQDGDILISWSASLGIYEWYGGKAWLNQHIFKVVFDKTEIDKIFFKFLILEKLEEMKSMVHGATMKHITKGKFDNLDVKIPSLEVQQQIAALLDRADTLRQLDRQLLSHYDTLIQSVFLEMFGDPVKNEKGWEVKILSDLALTQGGIQVSSDSRKDLPLEMPYLRVANVFRNFLNLSDIKTIRVTEQELNRIQLIKDDILMVEGHGNKNEIGRAAIWNGAIEKIVHQNHLIRVRANTSVLTPQFLCFYINSEGGRKQLFKSSNTTSGLNTISTGIVKKIEMILPSLSLQQRFAAIVEKIEAQKAIATAQAEASEALFLGLLQKAFGSK